VIRREIIAVAALLCAIPVLVAQQPQRGLVPLQAVCRYAPTVGSPAERLSEVRALAEGKKTSFLATPATDVASEGGCNARRGKPFVSVSFTSAGVVSEEDGAMWQGKGLNGAASVGLSRTWGRLQADIRPIFVFSQNLRFSALVRPSSETDFRNEDWPNMIDLPFRYGDRPFAQAFFGESKVQLNSKLVSGGISTASQRWGPARHYPLLVSSDGPGYPRMFVESRDISTVLGDFTSHWQVGFLEASHWSGLTVGQRSRVSSAFLGAYTPRWIPALTVGGARFFHVRREPGTLNLRHALLPFTGVLKTNSVDASVGGFNQLASAMFSLSPGAGVEVYGEFLRDDHNSDLRDLIGEPDHASAYVLGMRHSRIRRGVTEQLTLETLNSRFSHIHRVRQQAAVTTHSTITEGHTYRGQPIGSSALLDGGGMVVSLVRAAKRKATEASVELRRHHANGEGGTINGRPSESLSVRWGRLILADGHVFGVTGTYRLGFGPGSDSKFTLSTNWVP
jgi:hypothetical protein